MAVSSGILTGMIESDLDISCNGSSLPSPAVQHNGLLAMAVYEDISCDGDHMLDTSANLHMSVDETDHVTLVLDQDIVGKMCD